MPLAVSLQRLPPPSLRVEEASTPAPSAVKLSPLPSERDEYSIASRECATAARVCAYAFDVVSKLTRGGSTACIGEPAESSADDVGGMPLGASCTPFASAIDSLGGARI
eukprot:1346125-Rhodomonas_salina.1